ncbi:MAG: cold-shock protein [Alphaproteobacteria bacterium]
MLSGKVKWFNLKKGYGFITPDEGGNDVFVHITAVHESKLRSLQDNQPIGYDIKEENGKSCATNLTLK